MPIVFPDPRNATEDGIVAVGGNLESSTLLSAYKAGIFPWPMGEHYPLPWFSLDPRGVLYTDKLHISKSMRRFLNKTSFTAKFNTNFEEIISFCAKTKRPDQEGTWITDEISSAYTKLFHQGHAYCISVYDQDRIVGGLYGVCIGEIISAESMFHLESNASKYAIITLVEQLQKKNIPFVDTQMMTPVVEAMGGEEVEREFFLNQLKKLDSSRERELIFST